jgi:hypothetical protein
MALGLTISPVLTPPEQTNTRVNKLTLIAKNVAPIIREIEGDVARTSPTEAEEPVRVKENV